MYAILGTTSKLLNEAYHVSNYACRAILCSKRLEKTHSIHAKKATPNNPTTPPLNLVNLAASPVNGTSVLDVVGLDEPVGDTVVALPVLFKATQISGTSVAKATFRHQRLFLSFTRHVPRKFLLCSSALVQFELFWRHGSKSALIWSLWAQWHA